MNKPDVDSYCHLCHTKLNKYFEPCPGCGQNPSIGKVLNYIQSDITNTVYAPGLTEAETKRLKSADTRLCGVISTMKYDKTLGRALKLYNHPLPDGYIRWEGDCDGCEYYFCSGVGDEITEGCAHIPSESVGGTCPRCDMSSEDLMEDITASLVNYSELLSDIYQLMYHVQFYSGDISIFKKEMIERIRTLIEKRNLPYMNNSDSYEYPIEKDE